MNLEISESPDPLWNKRILLSKFGRYLQTAEHAKFLNSTSYSLYLKICIIFHYMV